MNDVACANCTWTGTDEEAESRVGDSACPECESIWLEDVTPPETFFHEFEVVSRKTGNSYRLTGIGRTRMAAEARLKMYTLAGLDLENDWTLRMPALAHYTAMLNESNAELAGDWL